MNFESFEKDFNKWMLEAHNENRVLKELLDDSFKKDIEELGKHFRNNPSAFVIDLQDLTERIFTDGIAKHEKLDDVKSSREVLRILDERKRVRKEQVEIVTKLNSLVPNDFEGIAFPSKTEFDEIKKGKVTQVFRLVDFEKPVEEKTDKEEAHVNRLREAEKDSFNKTKGILAKMKNSHEKYETLMYAYKELTKIASWYYRMYKETPDVGFQWELPEEENKQVERERMMQVGSFAGLLNDEYNIMKSPIRVYDKPVAVENAVQVDKIIEIEVPHVIVKEMPVDKIIEKEILKEVSINTITEVPTEKQVEVPFVTSNSVVEEKIVEKEIPLTLHNEIQTEKMVEIPFMVTKQVHDRSFIEKPVEVIKEIEVPQEFTTPVAVTKLLRPPSFFVAALFVLLFLIIGLGSGLVLRLIWLPWPDSMLEAENVAIKKKIENVKNATDTKIAEAETKTKEGIAAAEKDANAKVAAAVKLQKEAENARNEAIAAKDDVFGQIAEKDAKIDENNKQILDLGEKLSDLEAAKIELESQVTTLTAAKKGLEADKANLEDQLSKTAGLSKQQLEDLQKQITDKDTEIDNLKDKQKKDILELRDEYNKKLDAQAKDYDSKILAKDNDIRDRKSEIDSLNRQIATLKAQVDDLNASSTGASTKVAELRKTLGETEDKLAKAEDNLAEANRLLDSEKRKHKTTQDTLSATETELNKTKSDLALVKDDLIKAQADRDKFRDDFDSEVRKHKITKDELDSTKGDLDTANENISKANEDLAAKDKEIGDKNKQVTDLEKEVDTLKRQLDIFGEKDKMLKEEKILIEAAFATRTKDRAIKIENDIKEFLKQYPERSDNFVEALKFLEKAKLKESKGKTDDKTAEEFKLLAELSKGTAYYSPSAEELPGILNEILNRELGLAKSADIVLLIDTTSTMKNDIDTLKAEVAKVAQKIKDICPDVRTAIICYRDLPTKFGDPGYVYKIMTEFTIKTNKVINAINSITLSAGKGNYDIPEAVYEGIMGSLSDLHWSHRAEKKMIILMGDAPPATGKKVYIDQRTGRSTDLEATHKFTISSIKKKLEEMKDELESKETIQIFPIIIADDSDR